MHSTPHCVDSPLKTDADTTWNKSYSQRPCLHTRVGGRGVYPLSFDLHCVCHSVCYFFLAAELIEQSPTSLKIPGLPRQRRHTHTTPQTTPHTSCYRSHARACVTVRHASMSVLTRRTLEHDETVWRASWNAVWRDSGVKL